MTKYARILTPQHPTKSIKVIAAPVHSVLRKKLRFGLSLKFAVVAASTILAFAQVQAQETFDQQSLKERGALSVAQQTALQSKRELIKREASLANANEWVGTYVSEDGLTSGAQFDWAPDNGFLVWWSTCSYGWRDRINFGRVDFRDGVLRTTAELAGEGEKVFDAPGDLVTVKWGEQHFLVPLDRLIAFCYAARNDGRSFEIEEFFLKEGDREKRRFGLPVVPSQYQQYLVSPPILGTIVGLKTDSAPKTFTLNKGRAAGVVPGMKFFAVFPRNVYILAEVISVHENDSDAYVITSGFHNHSDNEVKPRAGWKLTSRAPRNASQYYPR